MQQDEFIQQHGGDLTPEQAAQLLELAMGDTGTTPDNGAAPDVPAVASVQDDKQPVVEQSAAPAATDTSAAEDPANAVILAKDGKHTIPYEKLVSARTEAQDWKAKAETAQAELTALQSQAQARADAGQAPTVMDNKVAAAEAAIDAGVDPALFGDFSEEDLTKGIQKLVDMRVDARVAEASQAIEAKLAQTLTPLQKERAESAVEAHFQAIYTKHPDMDSIAESQELQAWIAGQPSFLQDGYRAVMQQGTAPQVIEMLDLFKSATGKTQAAPADSVKAAAAAAVAAASAPVPASLSEIPGGTPASSSPADAMDKMSGAQLLDFMQEKGMTAQQIDAYLNSRV